MTRSRSPLLTASQWARRWQVHRNTARAWLAWLHERYGDRVVTRLGQRGTYVGTIAAVERRLPDIGRPPERVAERDVVTQQQFARAVAELWRGIRAARR